MIHHRNSSFRQMPKYIFFALVILVSCQNNPDRNHSLPENQTHQVVHGFINREALDESEGPQQDRPDLAWDQDFEKTKNPFLNRPTPEVLAIGRTNAKEYFNKKATQRVGTPEYPWIERGPNNVGGRTRALMWDPNDVTEKKVWAGGVTGGLWYNDDITNDNNSWINAGDFWDNLSITSIIYDPTNTQVIYVGTGEGWGASASRGAGIWKSTDGGTNWSQLPTTTNFHYINDLVVRVENNEPVIYAAVDGIYYEGDFHASAEAGLQRSSDGGVTWSQVLPDIVGESMNYVAADIEIAANNDLWVGTRSSPYAADSDSGGGYIMHSSNGTNWSVKHSVAVTIGDGRVELACAPSNANVVYGVIENDGKVGYMVKTTNAGTNWSNITEPNDADEGIPSDDFSRGQAWYDLILAVNPGDDQEIYVGGIDLFKSENGGTSWTQISHWYGGYQFQNVHADQHQIVFKPGSSSEAVFGNDGGVYLSTNMDTATPTIDMRNKNYNVTQFYATAIHPEENSDIFLAGSQDNGTQRFIKAGLSDTEEVTGGDGAYCFIDQTMPDIQIASYIYNSYSLSTNGGVSFTSFSDDQTSGSFINPADYDDNLGILYTNAGSSNIGRWTGLRTGSPNRNDISVSLDGSATHLRVSPHTSSSSTLFVGTSNGSVYKVTNANNTPSLSLINSFGSENGSVSCIEIGESGDHLLVTFSNYGVTSVWQTTNGGTTWSNKEGDLADMPVRWALYNPNDNNEVILATELGIWRTTDINAANPTWVPADQGLANVRIDMLQIRESDHEVVAATYGRGLFTSSGFSEIKGLRANLSASATSLISGDQVSFKDLSQGTISSWEWTFEGGTPQTSTDQNPTITYTSGAGSYDVSLTITDTDGRKSTRIAKNLITIKATTSLPNIMPYQPSGWSDAITIYNTGGGDNFKSDVQVTVNDDVHFALAIINSGDANLEESFNIKVTLDGTEYDNFDLTLSASDPINIDSYTYYTDISIGSLSEGAHEISLILDEPGNVAESNETDNTYTRHFYVNNGAIIWDGSSWSNTTGPTGSDDVVLTGNYHFAAQNTNILAVNDLTVFNNKKITVNNGGSLTVNGNITNNGAIVIKSGSSLLNYGSYTLTGNDIIVERNTRYHGGKYSFVGTPMESTTNMKGLNLGNNIYYYDETSDYGSNGTPRYKSALNEVLVSGRGYTQANQKKITFEGKPNAGTLTFAGSYTNRSDINDGWNLVSNPYVAAISATSFINANSNTSGTIYIWDDNGSDAAQGNNSDFIAINLIGATQTNSRAGNLSRYNNHIGSSQGFFVKLNSASNTDITFSESMRVDGNNSDDNFFRKSNIGTVKLNLTNDQGLFKQTLIGWVKKISDSEITPGYDASLLSNADNQLYTLKDGSKLSIQGVSEDRNEINIGLKLATSGTYQINLNNEEYEGSQLFLYDRKLQTFHDFNNGPFEFQNEKSILNSRFVLINAKSTILGDQLADTKVFAHDNIINIQLNGNQPEKTYKLFTLSGQFIMQKRITNSTKIDINHLTKGIYLLSNSELNYKIIKR